jgi:hypothetical protein
MMNEERRQLLARLLDETFGAEYAKKETMLSLADLLRTLMDEANEKEILFLHGLLDGAIAHASDRYNKLKQG